MVPRGQSGSKPKEAIFTHEKSSETRREAEPLKIQITKKCMLLQQ